MNPATRDPAITTFLQSASDALATGGLDPEAGTAISRIYESLAVAGAVHAGRGRRLPVCDRSLPQALAAARRHSPLIAGIVDAFEAIEPALTWAPRSASGPNASANWPDGHANAMIVGPGGLEQRDDMQIGVSLMDPHVRYPDHNHAPEEVYLVLSPGLFQHGDSDWFEPGIGGLLYNEPNIRHAMAADAAPLFALWFLRPDKTPRAA